MRLATAKPLTKKGERKIFRNHLYDNMILLLLQERIKCQRKRESALLHERDTAQKAVRHPLNKRKRLIMYFCLWYGSCGSHTSARWVKIYVRFNIRIILNSLDIKGENRASHCSPSPTICLQTVKKIKQ